VGIDSMVEKDELDADKLLVAAAKYLEPIRITHVCIYSKHGLILSLAKRFVL
jgi:hypothetical protein